MSKYSHEYYLTWKDRCMAQGLCCQCHHRRQNLHLTLCKSCREKRKEAFQRKPKKERPIRNCIVCGAECGTQPNRLYCDDCQRERRRVYNKTRLDKVRQERRCIRCGKAFEDNGRMTCDPCRLYRKMWRLNEGKDKDRRKVCT